MLVADMSDERLYVGHIRRAASAWVSISASTSGSRNPNNLKSDAESLVTFVLQNNNHWLLYTFYAIDYCGWSEFRRHSLFF
jgi:hypothetical protein